MLWQKIECHKIEMLIWLRVREEFLSSLVSHNLESHLKTKILKTCQGPQIRFSKGPKICHKLIEIDKQEIKRFKQDKINNRFVRNNQISDPDIVTALYTDPTYGL